MGEIYANNTKGKLAQPVGASDTVLELESGHSLPALSAGDWFRLTLYRWEFWPEGVREYDHEVLKVTDVSSNTLTVERGFEGVARSFDAGTNVELRPTAGTIGAVRSEAAQGITDHEAASDPHPQYTTSSEASAAASAEVSSHEAASDPHSQYTTATDAANAAPVQSVHGRTGNVSSQSGDYSASEVGADPAGTASAEVGSHASESGAHGAPTGERLVHTADGPYGISYKPSVGPTIASDFATNEHREYNPSGGFENITYAWAVWNYSRGSDATTVDPTGEVKLMTGEDPRFIFEDGVPQGVLIEESKTNLLLHSEDFTQSAWNKQRATITADATTAPDGTPTADKFAATTDNNFHQILQAESSLSCTAGVTVVTHSCFLKAGEITGARLFLFGPSFSSSGAGSTFDLSAGTSTTSGSTTSATMEYMRDGWWRCSITATATDTAVGFSVYIRLIGGSFAGNGVDGLYVWGAQAEEGGLTSYIPTTTTQVTRGADVYEHTLAADFNYEESTFFVDAISYPGSGFNALFSAMVGGDERYCDIAQRPEGSVFIVLRSDSVGYNNAVSITPTSRGIYKVRMAVSVREGEQIVVVDGVHQGTFNEVQLPTEPQNLSVGKRPGSATAGNSRVLAAKYYPRALSQEELEEITK